MIISLIGLMGALWLKSKSGGEQIGLVLFISGIICLIVLFILAFVGSTNEIALLSASLGLISIGLGFIALGVEAKSDKRHTEILKELKKDVARLPSLIRGDILTPPEQLFEEEMPSEQEYWEDQMLPLFIRRKERRELRKQMERLFEQSERSKEKAQKRLDEDTKKVGYVRGKIFKLEGGIWRIEWGGEYPL